ncbi:hypothetical protein [Micromonospora sp. WMMD964]|uniref:hypothetical protein n=1 Tax=Micromonospora sp. WMMD964 TaxID=3016091 RepID=UPI00249BF91F|nr:hypothetical protein [Micromonospora sp. WMMD964]WFE99194.1 hypothetical protein O7616_20080 [Micromonospora sp. WMMD964]
MPLVVPEACCPGARSSAAALVDRRSAPTGLDRLHIAEVGVTPCGDAATSAMWSGSSTRWRRPGTPIPSIMRLTGPTEIEPPANLMIDGDVGVIDSDFWKSGGLGVLDTATS